MNTQIHITTAHKQLIAEGYKLEYSSTYDSDWFRVFIKEGEVTVGRLSVKGTTVEYRKDYKVRGEI